MLADSLQTGGGGAGGGGGGCGVRFGFMGFNVEQG